MYEAHRPGDLSYQSYQRQPQHGRDRKRPVCEPIVADTEGDNLRAVDQVIGALTSRSDSPILVTYEQQLARLLAPGNPTPPPQRQEESERAAHRQTRPLPLPPCDRYECSEPGRLPAKSRTCSC